MKAPQVLMSACKQQVPFGFAQGPAPVGMTRAFVVLNQKAKAKAKPGKIKSKSNVKVKGDGQECPSHTGHATGLLASGLPRWRRTLRPSSAGVRSCFAGGRGNLLPDH